ncbi:MAG: UMP kinase [candidate division WOR-3 bacterium]|nr:MAG: UMP kinase [candidate division WOR-3 bacterium]
MKKKPRPIKYRRIILKLSGEFFGNDGNAFDRSAINYVADQIIQAKKMGAKIGVVVGGGNILRGRDAAWLDKIDADFCGMVGTVINGMVLHSILQEKGQKVKLSSGFAVEGITDKFNKFKDLAFYESGGTILFVGGTGNPLFTTDTAAALRAAEFHADVLIKGTKVAGVYSADPEKNKKAILYNKLTYDQAIQDNLEVMDLAAFNTCRQAGIPIYVYSFFKNKLCDVISGKTLGTIISGGRND